MAKMYPFSTRKYAHDIELYRNRIYNTMHDMINGEIEYDQQRLEKLEKMYYGELERLYDAVMFNTKDGNISYLDGNQLALAKRIVVWASETRANSCIERGRYDLIKYC